MPKRKPKKGKAARPKPKKRAPKKRAPKAPKKKRKAPRPKPKTRRKPRRIPVDDRYSDRGDVEVTTDDWEPVEDYEPHPVPDLADLRDLADRALEVHGEIEWFPRFDEVYDYIDALVEEYDLDAHELFEMAFGYSDEAQA